MHLPEIYSFFFLKVYISVMSLRFPKRFCRIRKIIYCSRLSCVGTDSKCGRC